MDKPCGCFRNPDTGYFEPCCEVHEHDYVEYLEKVRDLNISERLNRAGYSHTRTANSENTGKHEVTCLASGEVIGHWTAKEAEEFLASIKS